MRPIVFLDTETDALDPDYRQAWEIAFVRIDTDLTREERVFLVDIPFSAHSDRKSLEIGGYFDRHPRGRLTSGKPPLPGRVDILTPAEAALVVMGFTEGAQIFGAQPSFDTITLTNLLRPYGMHPKWYHRLRDVESMVMGHTQVEPGGLQDCAQLLGISSPEADQHTAMGDAKLVEAIWRRVMGHERPAKPNRGGVTQAEAFADMVGYRIQVAEAGHVLAEGVLTNVIRDRNIASDPDSERVTLTMDDGESYRLTPQMTAVILSEGASAGSID